MDRIWGRWVTQPTISEEFDSLREESSEAVKLVDISTFKNRSLSVQVPNPVSAQDAFDILCSVARIEGRMGRVLPLLSVMCSRIQQSGDALLMQWKSYVVEEGISQRQAPEWRVSAVFFTHTHGIWGRNLIIAKSYADAWTCKLESLRRIANRIKEAVDVIRGP